MSWKLLFCSVALGVIATNSRAGAADFSLADAVKKRDGEAVRLLLSQRVDVNVPQADGATALHWASYWDDLQTAEVLIRAGANLNARNDYGVTPLTLACTNGNAAMVKTLLAAGADAKTALPTGVTVLMTCARTGSAEAVKLLLERSAEPNTKEPQQGQTALMWAVAQKHAAVANTLIEHGADVHARSTNGFTPLMFAARSGDAASARVLLMADAEVNAAIKSGLTPLLMASASGHEAVSIVLLEHGADPNAWDGGAAPLHYAVMDGISYLHPRSSMPELVKALLAHGAKANVRFMSSYVTTRGYDDDTNLIGSGATPFLMAAAAGNLPMMRMLLAAGGDPTLATSDDTTPLMAAAGVGRAQAFNEQQRVRALEAVNFLLQLGADVNASNKIGRTALHGATVMVADSIIQFLAEHGANLDARDMYQQTALSAASGIRLPWVPMGRELGEEGGVRQSTMELLLKLGATPLNTPGYFTPVETDSEVYRLNPRQGKIPGIN